MPRVTEWTPAGIVERDANAEELAAIEQAKQPRPLPLSTRLERILNQYGATISAIPNPDASLLTLVDAIMTIDNKLSAIASRFGGNSELYRAAAVSYLTQLGELPPELEPARQAMLIECDN